MLTQPIQWLALKMSPDFYFGIPFSHLVFRKWRGGGETEENICDEIFSTWCCSGKGKKWDHGKGVTWDPGSQKEAVLREHESQKEYV